MSQRIDLTPGTYWFGQVGYSEVACALKVAGTRMMQHLSHDGRTVQLLRGGEEYSFPVLATEAGCYQDASGTYTFISSVQDVGSYEEVLRAEARYLQYRLRVSRVLDDLGGKQRAMERLASCLDNMSAPPADVTHPDELQEELARAEAYEECYGNTYEPDSPSLPPPPAP